jgi:nitrogen fixation protein FixH
MRPTLLILFLAFLTIFPSIYVGIKYFDGKVTAQPYESGLKYDENKKFIEDNELSLQILNINTVSDESSISFNLKKKEGLDIENVKWFLTRPATNKDMISLAVTKDGQAYSTVFTTKSYGYHVLEALAVINGKEVHLKKGFYINDKS